MRERSAVGPALGARVRGTADEPGYLGIKADDRGPGNGVRLLEVKPGGPAEQGGLQPGDLITAVRRQPVRTMERICRAVRRCRPARSALRVLRGDEVETIDVVLGRRPGAATAVPQLRLAPPKPAAGDGRPAPLGVRVQRVSEAVGRPQGLATASGAHITNVTKGSAADKAGITADAVIVAINGREIASPDDAAGALWEARVGQPLEFKLYEQGQLVARQRCPRGGAGQCAAARPAAPTVVEASQPAATLPAPARTATPARPAAAPTPGPPAGVNRIDSIEGAHADPRTRGALGRDGEAVGDRAAGFREAT